ncbi:MAG: tRNA epoxyqueuosine(34) reductase QueG [Planctomycetota bacterium]|nr:tRNA epoxyqueuosine(34) reductase QueG [Planctomycetota bacterium]
MSRAEEVVFEIASELGFDLCGIAPVAPPPAAARFEAWLDAGRHAGMDWLERDRERLVDPRRVMPEGGSIVVLGLAHARAAVELEGGGRVARYAAGRDYHNVGNHKLRRFARRLAAAGLGGRNRRIVDAGPLLERSHAARAGLGFESKAANLLHPRFGPWFFLMEVMIPHELEPTTEPPAGSCGTCRACLDACPTQAIVEPGVVDAGRCISYWTIEHQGPIAPEVRERMGPWAFGCDVCSEVCPWGARAPDLAERFGTHAAVASSSLVAWLEAGDAFTDQFAASPLDRPGRAGVARNAAIALASAPSDLGRRALLRALSFDPSAVVREAAGWSLARTHAADDGVRPALESAAARESDPQAKELLARWAESASERGAQTESTDRNTSGPASKS